MSDDVTPPNANAHTLRMVLTSLGTLVTLVSLTTCAMAIQNARDITAMDKRMDTIETREETNRTFDRLQPQRYAPPPSRRFNPAPTESEWH